MRICIYGAASRTINEKYIKATEELGERLAKRGHTLVFGGGAGGLMGAAARGFTRGGCEDIISIAPSFFNVDGVLYEKCSQYISPDTMRERKRLLEEYADAFIVTPGGIGTLDEFFEIITLRSLARLTKPVVIFNCEGYYDQLLDLLDFFEKEHFVNLCDGALFGVEGSIEAVCDFVENEKRELLNPHNFRDVK